jgi:hypothetical protein
MGFNQCYLPSVKAMEEYIEQYGMDKFINSYRKYDSISGESDRIQFLENKIKEYELQQIQMVD